MRNNFMIPCKSRRFTLVLCILPALCLFGLHGVAQNWDWQNPLPQGVNLYSVHFPSADIGYSVGMDGTILKTENGGQDWFAQESGVTTSFASVFFLNEDTGYVVGYDNVVHMTTNGGADWIQLAGPSPSLTDVYFVNSNLGYAVGSNGSAGIILKTENGGVDWVTQNVATVTYYNSVFFLDENIGYVAGNGGKILKTIDGGATWVNQTSGTTSAITSIYFTDDQNGYAVTYGKILKTINGGTTWTSVTIYQAYELYSVKFTDANTGYAVGRSGIILKTTNAGASWSFLTTNTTITLRSVFFTDALNGMAVGESGIMLKTNDAGLTWVPFSTSAYYEDLEDVHFVSDCHGVAVGDNGTILKTTNGGGSWTLQNSGVTNHLSAVHFTSEDVGYVVGTSGLISKTSDGGETWSTQTSGSTVTLQDVYFTGVDTGYVVGVGGIILKTIDGGANWLPQTSNVTNNLTSVHFVNANLGFIVGASGRLLKTIDGGSTWTVLYSGTSLDLNAVYFPTAQIGYLTGVSGHIRKTTNGGTNWTQQTNNINIALKSIAFTDANNGYAVGYDYNHYGKIYRTIDGGTIWSVETISWDHDLNAVEFVDGNIPYMVGNNGAILKTKMDAATADNSGSICAGGNFSLQVSTVAGASYAWSGPNDFTSNEQNPVIESASAAMSGEYSVLVSLNNCTSTTATTMIMVYEAPATPVIMNVDPICEGASLALSAEEVVNASYAWTGPNGFSSSEQNPIITTTDDSMAGVYALAVTVNNCTSEAAETTVEINPIPATPVIMNVDPICEGASLALSAEEVVNASYAWTGPNGFSSSEQNPIITNTDDSMAGVYALAVTVNNCTSESSETTVEINLIPTTPVIMNVDPICEGASLALSAEEVLNADYAWTGPNGFSSSEQNPIINTTDDSMAGVYSLAVTVNNCTSEAAETTVEINLIPATPVIMNVDPICEGASLALASEEVVNASYAWTGPNGFSSSEQNPIINTTDGSMAGVYALAVTVDNCTSEAAETTVEINPIPDAPVVSSNGPVDEGTALTLSAAAIAGASYTWSGPNGFTSTEQNPTVSEEASMAMAGVYEVSVLVNGCESATASVVVVVNEVNGVNDVLGGLRFNVYPNPATDRIWIELPSAEFNHLQIVNALGAVVVQENIYQTKAEVNVSDLAPGMYSIILSSGDQRVKEKLLKN